MHLTEKSGLQSLRFKHERVKYRVILRIDVFAALQKRCISSGEGQRANKQQEEGRTAEDHVVLAYTHTTTQDPLHCQSHPLYRSTVRQLKLHVKKDIRGIQI